MKTHYAFLAGVLLFHNVNAAEPEPEIDLMALMAENQAKVAAQEAALYEMPASTEESPWS